MSSLHSGVRALPRAAAPGGFGLRVYVCATLLVLATLLDFAGNPEPLRSLPAYGLQIVLACGLFCSRRWGFQATVVLFAMNILVLCAGVLASPGIVFVLAIHAGVLWLLASAWPRFFPNPQGKRGAEALRDWIDEHPLREVFRRAPVRLRIIAFYLLVMCVANLLMGFVFGNTLIELADAERVDIKDFKLFGLLSYMTPLEALSAALVCLALAGGLVCRNPAAYSIDLYLCVVAIATELSPPWQHDFPGPGLWIDLVVFAVMVSLWSFFFDQTAPTQHHEGIAGEGA